MAVSFNRIAYGCVIVTGAILFLVGTPDERALRTASAAPAPAEEPGQAPAALSAVASGGVTLRSISVQLPDDRRDFPGGAVAEAINNNCLACHSAGMVLNQPAMPKEAWTGEVNKMINAYKAPVAPGDVDAIVSYLSHLQGGH